MKRWALVVVALYLLILVVLTVPVSLLAFAPQASAKEIAEVYRYFPYWLWVGVMVLGQAALLAVPVRNASRRPIARRSLLWPWRSAPAMSPGHLTVIRNRERRNVPNLRKHNVATPLARHLPPKFLERPNRIARPEQRHRSHQIETSISRVATVAGSPISARTARHSRMASLTLTSASASDAP